MKEFHVYPDGSMGNLPVSDDTIRKNHYERLTGRCRVRSCHLPPLHDNGIHAGEQSPRVPSGEAASERRAGGGCGDAFAPIPGVQIVGFGHKARHGKDTATEILVKEFGAKRYSFADDLYAIARVMHGMQGKDAPLLQRVGLEWRERDENVWVKSVYSKLLLDRPRLAVISDVRFLNEMAFVRALGGVCWKVKRVNDDYTPFIDPSRPADHPSETALDDAQWDRVILNRDLDNFKWAVSMLYRAQLFARIAA